VWRGVERAVRRVSVRAHQYPFISRIPGWPTASQWFRCSHILRLFLINTKGRALNKKTTLASGLNSPGVKLSVMNTTRLPDVKRPLVMRAVSAEQINIQQVTIVATGTASDFMAVPSLRKVAFIACLRSICLQKVFMQIQKIKIKSLMEKTNKEFPLVR